MGERKAATIPELLSKKRDGLEYSTDEIDVIVKSVIDGSMQQSQIGALLMAIRLKGMTKQETIDLTSSMRGSGDTLSWPQEWRHLVVDKHSTGGVGDKVSLVLAPALAACGCKVPMISGRGLGHTGGTLDKLESIPGFRVSQSMEDIEGIVDRVGCCIVSQTKTLAPADAILYVSRDVTSTVDSIPLIAASIVSKKSAEGLTSLLLDVKIGKAAWSEDMAFIEDLANTMVSVSEGLGVKTTAVITDMNNPLGSMVGNALEVVESIKCLQNKGPQKLTDLIIVQGGHLLHNIGVSKSVEEGSARIRLSLQNGSALNKFKEMLVAQGVAPDVASKLVSADTDPLDILPRASHKTDITAQSDGFIQLIDAMECAIVCNYLGAGRTRIDSVLDYSVGLEILKHVGDRVHKGDIVMRVHHNGNLSEKNELRLERSVKIASTPPAHESRTLVLKVI